MSESLPLVMYRRALLPGTRATVPTPRDDLAVGDRVVVVLEHADGSRGSVGTEATVAGMHSPAFGGRILEVHGLALVDILDDGERPRIRPIDRLDWEAARLVPEVRSRLRRYMAVRAEAGQHGDVLVDIDDDPIAASHEVASHLQISWPEIQEILEAGDAGARLRLEAMILDRETELLRAVLGRARP